MIKELHVQNFKRFRNKTFTFRREGVSLLAGGNNSGKSSILQALAIWEFCRFAVEAQRGRSALEGGFKGNGIPIGTDDFSPIALPSLAHLWTNLKATPAGDAGQRNISYDLRITCKWDDDSTGERQLGFGLMLAQDRVYVKPLVSNIAADEVIPRCAYLPPFAGITAREERMSPAMQRRLIGRGLAGATLRNILFDLEDRSKKSLAIALAGRKRLSGEVRRRFYQSDPWLQLCDVLQTVFRCCLQVPTFDDRYHTTVSVKLFRGDYHAGAFKKYSGYTSRDIMVEGSGLLQWLSVYALAVTPEINILLLDEPDAHLHPTLQSHLLDRLRSLANDHQKQVLLATHSTELLRRVEPADIFELSEKRYGYLSLSAQRVGLFSGLGSEYCPKLDEVRRHKNVLFHEGSFDEAVLRVFANTMGKPLPSNLAFWQFAGNHKQRRVIFEELRIEMTGLQAISLRDRDTLDLKKVGPNLVEHEFPDDNGLRFRTWRRRHFENYLVLPAAIARASGQSEDDVGKFLSEIWGIPINTPFQPSNCVPGLLDARGKEAMDEGIPARNGEAAKQSIGSRFGCSRHDVARQMRADEIPEDVRNLIEAIHLMCAR